MIPDLLNGIFEALGGLMILNHCRVLLKDKEVKGVSVLSMCFFTSWGLWNLFYYPHLDQWWSFFGGVVIVTANALWISLMLLYSGAVKRWLDFWVLPASPPIRSYTAEEYSAMVAKASADPKVTAKLVENITKRNNAIWNTIWNTIAPLGNCAYEQHSGLNACFPGRRNCKLQTCTKYPPDGDCACCGERFDECVCRG